MEAFCIPAGYERRFLQMNSAGELVVIDPFEFPTGPSSNPLVRNPLWNSDIV
jgi:hypothetical protein